MLSVSTSINHCYYYEKRAQIDIATAHLWLISDHTWSFMQRSTHADSNTRLPYCTTYFFSLCILCSAFKFSYPNSTSFALNPLMWFHKFRITFTPKMLASYSRIFRRVLCDQWNSCFAGVAYCLTWPYQKSPTDRNHLQNDKNFAHDAGFCQVTSMRREAEKRPLEKD